MKSEISRRRFLTYAGASLPALGGLGATAQSRRRPPNILFIAVDDLKPMLGCYGDDKIKSPNIDRIAERGMVFRNNLCQQAVCGPSRASLLTGLRPDTTRVWDLATRMRDMIPDVLTLPQYFKQKGYTTLGMGKIFDGRCCDGWGSQDKASWSAPFLKTGGRLYANKKFSSQKPTAKNRDKVQRPPTECADVEDTVYTDGMAGQLGAEILRKLSSEKNPFFLAVGFVKPHLPFCAPKKYWDLYKRKEFRVHPFQERSKNGPDIAYHDSGELRGGYTDVPRKGPLSEEKQLELIHGYHAAVSFMDAQVGKLLDEMDRQGVVDNTIVVLWGDHGWHLGDHGMWCKHSNFEQASRAPLLIAAPKARAKGGSADSPTEFVDIFPTLCDLAGLPIPSQLEGASLVPILNDPLASVKAAAIGQYPRSDGGKRVMGYAYRTRRYRYVEWVRKDYRKGEKTGPVIARELYDYEKDPMEKVNAIDDPDYAKVRRRLEKVAKDGWKKLRGKDFDAYEGY